MARNNYLKVSNRESNLFADLVAEQIKIYGFDVHYIFRKFQNLDTILGEDPVSSFNKSFQIEMLVSNYEFFETQNKFIDKFGINLLDSVTLMVAKKRFSEEVAKYGTDLFPQEGDLIYFPEYGGLYEIKYVGTRNSFFAYELSCEKFRYSGEKIGTEIKEVDEIETDLFTDIRRFALSSRGGTFYEGEQIYQGLSLGSASYSAIILNFNAKTNTIDVRGERGSPTSISPFVGEKSGATAFYSSVAGTTAKYINGSADDSARLEYDRARTDLIDFTDKDPFSEGNY